MQIDEFDLRILASLQERGQLTNQQLAERVHLSPSQCSRRRSRLEKSGVISGYRAVLNAPALGFGITVIVEVKLSGHSGDNAKNFRKLVASTPAIQAGYALTGDFDYLLKGVVRDLPGLQALINDTLLPHETVAHVRSNIVLEELKSGQKLPLLNH